MSGSEQRADVRHDVTRGDVERAAERIRGLVRRTPVLAAAAGDLAPGPVVLKLELLQHTGSFKARGAFHSLLSAPAPPTSVVAASGGNHGLAVAYAAAQLGLRADVFVPESAPAAKVDRLRATGARVHVGGRFYADAAAASETHARTTPDALVVHAYDGVATVAGQGTVGLELAEQVPDVDTVLVAVGGGGLAGGIAAAVGGGVRVVGVETRGCAAWQAARRAGRPVDVEVGGLAADSLGARRLGAVGFAALTAAAADAVVVEDEDLVEARAALWDSARLVAEPGGVAALAALRSGAYRPAAGEQVAVVLCGANTAPPAVASPAR